MRFNQNKNNLGHSIKFSAFHSQDIPELPGNKLGSPQAPISGIQGWRRRRNRRTKRNNREGKGELGQNGFQSESTFLLHLYCS